MQTQAVILDLDGTVLESPTHKVPTPRVVRAIQALQKKCIVSAASGRAWSFAKPVLDVLKLTNPSIISGGTQICNSTTGEILWQKNIPGDALKKISAVLREYPDYNILANDMTEDDYLYGGTSPKDFVFHGDYYFIAQVFIPDALATEVHGKLSKIDGVAATMVVAQKKGFRDIHITNASATKEHSIGVLLQMLKVKKEHVIGVGDGNNDIHLFTAVGHKVAMGNAVPVLKEAADEVIGSVSEDGLADYLEKLTKRFS